MTKKPTQILLVEDNPADANLIFECFEDSKVVNEIKCVADGVQAMEFLVNQAEDPAQSLPDLMLLDLNLPRKSGREVLAEVRANPALRKLPVIVLTSSEAEIDITKSYDLGANAYITKPVDLAQLERIVGAIEEFWFQIAKLPEHH